jgi:transcriptional regulator with XRE-family HTH domain
MPVGKGKQHASQNRVLTESLRNLRQAAGLTQVELAKRMGKPQSFISKVERGERIIDVVELRWWCREVGADLNKVVREWDRRLGR